MKLRAQVVCGLMVLLTGCLGGFRTGPPIYEDKSLTVRLEPNSSGDGQAQMEKGATISAQRLADVLQGLYGRKKVGFLMSYAGTQSEYVFNTDELPLVARELQKGLSQVSPKERVAFELSRPGRKGPEETSGAVYQRGNFLYVVLKKFRSDARSHGLEYSSSNEFELFYEPAEAVVHEQQGSASGWFGADSIGVIIDIRKVAGGVERAVLSPAPSVVPPPARVPVEARPPAAASSVAPSREAGKSDSEIVKELQRQVKDLAESNEALRAKLKQAQGGQEPSQSVTEELVRLRQELAETKQLLAEKVLELNRLQKQR